MVGHALLSPIDPVQNGSRMFAAPSAGNPTSMDSDDMKGKVKETTGKVTGNERLENEGRAVCLAQGTVSIMAPKPKE